ncbi:MAG: AI-2E family transporter, partial [Myxococcota bacterium]
LNVIPYVGFAVGSLLSVLVVLIEWTGFGALVGVGVVFAVVQGLEGYVITPKIVGEKVGLSPVTVIIVLLIGAELAGLLGVLLAIPVAGAIKVILPDVARMYKASAYYTGVGLPATQEAVDEEELTVALGRGAPPHNPKQTAQHGGPSSATSEGVFAPAGIQGEGAEGGAASGEEE